MQLTYWQKRPGVDQEYDLTNPPKANRGEVWTEQYEQNGAMFQATSSISISQTIP
jgi:hypothetical protein